MRKLGIKYPLTQRNYIYFRWVRIIQANSLELF